MTDILYAAKGSFDTTSDLYTVNTGTAATTSVGPIGFAMTGLAYDPTTETMYGVTNGNSAVSPKHLVTIDLDTGDGTDVGALSSKAITDIAFTSAGLLYGWNQTDAQACSINKASGAVTNLGASGLAGTGGCGLSFNSGDVYYICPLYSSGNLYTVNLGTGAPTALGTMDDTQPGMLDQDDVIAAAAFDTDDVLWGIQSVAYLITLNVSTRVWSFVGELGGTKWDALAWGPGPAGPEPTPIEGVVFAFEDSALEPSPAWTRIDV